MKDFDDELRELVRIDPTTKVVASRENSRLEFKNTFNLGSASRYLRTMAAFANARVDVAGRFVGACVGASRPTLDA